jgi:hypothetical protein
MEAANVERIQFSLRAADFGAISALDATAATVAIESAHLSY